MLRMRTRALFFIVLSGLLGFGGVAGAGDLPPGGVVLLETNRLRTTTDKSWVRSVRSPIAENDLLLLAFAISGTADAPSACAVQVRRSGASFGEYASFPIRLQGQEHQTIRLPFRVREKAEQLDIRFYSGNGPLNATIETLTLLNYGPRANAAELPQTPLTYKGREADAAWRPAARDRIERIRMGNVTVRVLDRDGQAVDRAGVHLRMRRHRFRFGTAVTAQLLAGTTPTARRFRDVVESNFNAVVFENDLKPGTWEISQSNTDPSFRWTWTDTALTWLKDKGLQVRGHYLVSGRLSPADFSKFLRQPEKLRGHIFAHIGDKLPVLGHRVDEWDAINHVAVLDTSLESIFQSLDIFVDIMQYARHSLPDMPLWVNEGTILPGGLRRDHYEKTLRYLIDFHAAPDGIGMMGQFTPAYIEDPDALYAILDRFAALIPHLQITELVGSMNEDEALQADYLRDVMTLAFSHPAMEGITLWGFWEGRHPIPQAALLRRDWSPKPAWHAWRQLVFNEWWTDERLVTGTNGVCSTHGFLGEYEIKAAIGNATSTVAAVVHGGDNLIEIRLP